MNPEISVCMPVFNAGPFLEASIESVLSQSVENFEFLIIDDASTDTTPDILDRFRRGDCRVQLLRNDRNRGVTVSLKRAIAAARGSLIARQDADDLSLPGRFAAQLRALRERPELGVVGTWTRYVGLEGREPGTWRTPCEPMLVRWCLSFGTAISHPTAMMRRRTLAEHGDYASGVRYAQDYELWARLAPRVPMANVPAEYYCRRVHGEAIGARKGAEQEAALRTALRRLIAVTLGRGLSDQEVGRLRRLGGHGGRCGVAEMGRTLGLLLEMRQRFLRATSPSQSDRRAIAQDTLRRARRLLRSQVWADSHSREPLH